MKEWIFDNEWKLITHLIKIENFEADDFCELINVVSKSKAFVQYSRKNARKPNILLN